MTVSRKCTEGIYERTVNLCDEGDGLIGFRVADGVLQLVQRERRQLERWTKVGSEKLRTNRGENDSYPKAVKKPQVIRSDSKIDDPNCRSVLGLGLTDLACPLVAIRLALSL
jgi:hypothetical protein